MDKITERDSNYRHLDQMSTAALLRNMNREDQRVAKAVGRVIPSIISLVDRVAARMQEGGRLFYLGAGTSGRLGILDASECPPTFGVPQGWVVGIIAGGERAVRFPVEYAEDSTTQAWEDLSEHLVDEQDVVIGIAASGTTPYVVHGLLACQERGITTGCITCNYNTPLAAAADFPIEVIVGPEFVTGSSRLKAGTAQKMILNMISTSVMIKLGRVVDNRMVDMQLSNTKLVDRGTRMIQRSLNIPYDEARKRLLRLGSVRAVLEEE